MDDGWDLTDFEQVSEANVLEQTEEGQAEAAELGGDTYSPGEGCQRRGPGRKRWL